MATHGDHRMNGSEMPRSATNGRQAQQGSFPGTNGDQWHRALTGRQAPEPVSTKLKMIYGNVVAEPLPDAMLDLLHQLDQKAPGHE